MKDTELCARLQSLGMPASDARNMTALIRDKIHPVAELSLIKARDHLEGLSLLDGLGLAGLDESDAVAALDEYGYVMDGTSGLLKKVGKAVKKVAKTAVKVVKKVAAPVAAIVAAPVTGGASIAAYGAIKSAKIGKKASKAANAAAIAQTNALITQTPIAVDSPLPTVSESSPISAPLAPILPAANTKAGRKANKKATKAAAKAAKEAQQAAAAAAAANAAIAQSNALATPTAPAADPAALSKDIKKRKKVRVPKDVSKASDAMAASLVKNGEANATTDSLMQALISGQTGANMSSPAAQGILQDVASQGVEATPAGPAPAPSWLMPVGIAAAGVVVLILLGRRK